MFDRQLKKLTSGILEIDSDSNVVVFHMEDKTQEISFAPKFTLPIFVKPIIQIESTQQSEKKTQLNDITYYQKRNIMSFMRGDIVKSMMMVNKEFNKAFKDPSSTRAKLSLLQWQYRYGVTNFENRETDRLNILIEMSRDRANKHWKEGKDAKKWEGIKVGDHNRMSTYDWMACCGGVFCGFSGAVELCMIGLMQWAPGGCCPSTTPDCAVANLGGAFAYKCGCCFPLSNACIAGYSLTACAICLAAPLAINTCCRECKSHSIEKTLANQKQELENLPAKCENIKERLLMKMNFFAEALLKDQQNNSASEERNRNVLP